MHDPGVNLLQIRLTQTDYQESKVSFIAVPYKSFISGDKQSLLILCKFPECVIARTLTRCAPNVENIVPQIS